MSWAVLAVIALSIIALCVIGLLVYKEQKELDAPFKGLLLVDKQDVDGPAMVYLQALVDPGTFNDGEEVKLRVRVVKPEKKSQ